MTVPRPLVTLGIMAISIVLAIPAARAATDPLPLYLQYCASCHGADRLGAVGPALLPDNLGRLKPAQAEQVIAAGRPATEMKGFADRLSPEQITVLAAYVFSPPAAEPAWGMAQIAASHTVHADRSALPARPPFAADPLNLFLVVEAGDHHVTILDGGRMAPLYRLPSRFALHGGAKFSPDGRFVFLMSRDGWVSKLDMWTGTLLAEVRAGINSRNIAVSADGRFVLVGNLLPDSVVVLAAADLSPLKVIPVSNVHGQRSRVSAVYTAPPRHSFIVALLDAKEIWEIPYTDPPRFRVRRIETEDTLDDFFFDPAYRDVIATSRDGGSGEVVDLMTGRRVATLPLTGMPHLGSGITFTWHGRPVFATPHMKEAAVSVIAMDDWSLVKRIPTCGPGYFIRGHQNTPYAWVDCSLGKDKDSIQVIDTRTLTVVRTLRPEPGKTAAHVEFTRDGRYALVSIMEDSGALIVYDAATFAEVKRIPMRHPVGKYNVFNKITYAPGTSH